MPHIVKVIRMLNKGHYGLAEVELDDGGTAVVHIGGEVTVILHNQVIKAYMKLPWQRPKQSRKNDLDDNPDIAQGHNEALAELRQKVEEL